MTYTFIPLFTKYSMTKNGPMKVTLQHCEVDRIIYELAKNKQLINLMDDYINNFRHRKDSPSKNKDIELRKLIFPYFENALRGNDIYTIFSSDLAEEMFHRLESGILEK